MTPSICPQNIKRERRNAVRMRQNRRRYPPHLNVARMQLRYEQWMREEAINLLVSLAREGVVGPVCPSAPKKKTHAVKRCGHLKPKKLKF
jgi:hypothetical protein